MNKLLLGILLCSAAVATPVFWVLSVVNSFSEGTVAFEAPGEIVLTVDEPGHYYLWNEYETIYRGRTYSQSKNVPSGVEFSLTLLRTRETLFLQSGASISTSVNGSEKNSVGYFEIEEPGEYRLTVEGLDQPRIFSFGRSLFDGFGEFVGRFVLGFLFAVFGLIAGGFLIIFGIIEIVRKDKSSPYRERPPEMPR